MSRLSPLLTDSVLLSGLDHGLARCLTKVWTREEVCMLCSEVHRPHLALAPAQV